MADIASCRDEAGFVTQNYLAQKYGSPSPIGRINPNELDTARNEITRGRVSASEEGGLKMVLRVVGALAAILFSAVVGQAQAPRQTVDVTGAWDVTITISGGSVSGLAVLSQDGPEVTGMLGPALTDMFPVAGSWGDDKLTIVARPRKGRTTAFTNCELTGSRDRMTGTIDTNKGTIEFIRKKREGR